MNIDTILDDVIGGIRPQDVPLNFIVMAQVVDRRGNHHTIEGPELKSLINKTLNDAKNVRVILDVKGIKYAMMSEIDSFFSALQKRVSSSL